MLNPPFCAPVATGALSRLFPTDTHPRLDASITSTVALAYQCLPVQCTLWTSDSEVQFFCMLTLSVPHHAVVDTVLG